MKISLVLFCALAQSNVLCNPELKLLHVIFAHQMYAPTSDVPRKNVSSFVRNLSYGYLNEATTTLSNTAKLNLHNLGVHLRKMYGAFLGETYRAEIVKVRTTEFPVSIMSAQLVNSGLWPPTTEQTWNEELRWQPIPLEYQRMQRDTLLLGTLCPNFRSWTNQVLAMKETKAVLSYHRPLFDYVSRHTGLNVSQPSHIAFLYHSLETSGQSNRSLPYWANGIFPDGEMYNVTLLEYDVLSRTPLQRQLNGGTILKEIVGNCLQYIHGNMSQMRKLMLYSGDGRNVAGVLKNLDLWSPHIPAEAAALIFELYFDNETSTHGIKINYYMGIEKETIPLMVPNCTDICPMRKFARISLKTIPENEESLCGWFDPHSVVTEEPSISVPTKSGSRLISLQITLLLFSPIILLLA